MSLPEISIKNPVFAWMLMAALIIFGGISFSRLGISQFPDVDFPILNISVELEGASPEVIESTVVEPLEGSLISVEGVTSIKSSSKTGQANITLEFDLGKNIDVALQEVQTKVAQAQRVLPSDIEAPVITKTNPDDQPILWLALTYTKDDPVFLMKFARNYISDRFSTVPGVGDIILGGYTDPALRIWVKPDSLTKYNIAVTDIIQTLEQEHKELPGGLIETKDKNFNVRTLGEAKSVPEFESLIISRRGGQQIADSTNMLRLSQVARVEENLNEIRRISRFNGQPALGIGIRKQKGSNAVAVANAVKEKMNAIQDQLPEGMKLQVNFDSTQFIKNSVNELNKHLFFAALLTALVCWVFLGSWSATFNVILSIPTSIMGTFIALYFLGFTLNTFTLLALTLAIGIVVDDAIMVLENIFRYTEKGYTKIDAALEGSREITFAALAATAAVVAIFLPVAFMKGVIGQFFLQFGVTISIAVLLSLLEALTITPMRCASFVQHGQRTTKIGLWFEQMMNNSANQYKKILNILLVYPRTVLGCSIAVVILSFYAIKFLKKEFTPAQDQGLFIARLQMPVGTSLAKTNIESKKIEEWLRSQPEIKQVYASVGGFGGGISDANIAVMFVTMKEKNQRQISQQKFIEQVRKNLKLESGIKMTFQDLSQRGFSSGRGFPIEFTVLGANWEELYKQTQILMDEMQKSGLMTDIDSNYLLGMPELQITPQRSQAALHGVSVNTIGQAVNALIGGILVGQYNKDGHRYDIRLQLEKQKDPQSTMQKLLVSNPRGNLVPLSRLTQSEIRPSLQSISRVDRQRAITVYANLTNNASQQEALNFISQTSKKILQPGYFTAQDGSSKTFRESFQSLIFALIMGFIVAYMVLASQFNSFLDPVTVLLALPFSLTGAFLSLLITGQSLNIYSMIGLLLLMGIVKKNSILLVEFANVIWEKNKQNQSLNMKAALLEACPIRLRPILMTSLATIAGAVPSALASGAGSETVKPMAIAIIGGVFISTVLTLFVVPCGWLIFQKWRH